MIGVHIVHGAGHVAQAHGPGCAPGRRFLNGLNPNDPKVASALKACQSKLPTFPRPSGSPSAA
jgi:hypothetical protein